VIRRLGDGVRPPDTAVTSKPSSSRISRSDSRMSLSSSQMRILWHRRRGYDDRQGVFVAAASRAFRLLERHVEKRVVAPVLEVEVHHSHG